MRVLTLDDMEIRQNTFQRWFIGHEHIHAWTAPGAIRELEGPPFDLVMLDHDLAEEHYLTASGGLSETRKRICDCAFQDTVLIQPEPLCGECGGTGEVEAPEYAPGTGMDVVDHIVRMPTERRPRKVIVHSWNPVRSTEMFNRLREAGVAVWKIPFSPLMPINLK